jgi:hypothetical protein
VAQQDLQQVQNYLDNGQANKAKTLLEEKDQSLQEVGRLNGEVAIKLEQWENATSIFENLVEENPQNADFHFKYAASLGMQALEMSKFEAAFHIGDVKKHFENAAELDQNHLASRWALVRLYLELPGMLGGSTNKARQTSKELMRINKADGWLSKGYIAEYEEKKTRKKFYTKALENEKASYCFQKLKELYEFSLKNPKTVFRHSKNIFKELNVNEFNYQLADYAWNNKVGLKQSVGLLKKFIDEYSGTEETDLAYAYLRMAQIHKELGKKVKAKHWINKAVAQKDNFAIALKTQSQLYMK